MVAKTLRAYLRAALLAVGIAMLARVLMRLVALDTSGTGGFSLEGTLGICCLFVRWVGFWSLFVAISAVLTPYVGARAGRSANTRHADSGPALVPTA